MIPETITVTRTDYMRLKSLIDSSLEADIDEPELENLEEELERAQVLEASEVPSDLVVMNTKFRYLNVTDNKEHEMMLVYPQHANSAEKHISVTASLGAAMIGLREGDEIDWTFPDGKSKRLRIIKVLHQPDA